MLADTLSLSVPRLLSPRLQIINVPADHFFHKFGRHWRTRDSGSRKRLGRIAVVSGVRPGDTCSRTPSASEKSVPSFVGGLSVKLRSSTSSTPSTRSIRQMFSSHRLFGVGTGLVRW